MSDVLKRLGVAECSEGGSRCRCVDNAGLVRAYEIGVRDYERILIDLIAELVGDDGDGHEITPEGDACRVCEAIDKAEAQLREAD